MRVLNKRKVRWIINEMIKGELSVWRIAKQQKVSSRWVRKLYTKYLQNKEYPFPKKPGRPPTPLSKQEVGLVKRLFAKQPFGAVNMEKILSINGKHMPHNRIHKIMKQEGLALTQPNKSKRRKWIRYERKYSNSLWHIDWSMFEKKMVNRYPRRCI